MKTLKHLALRPSRNSRALLTCRFPSLHGSPKVVQHHVGKKISWLRERFDVHDIGCERRDVSSLGASIAEEQEKRRTVILLAGQELGPLMQEREWSASSPISADADGPKVEGSRKRTRARAKQGRDPRETKPTLTGENGHAEVIHQCLGRLVHLVERDVPSSLVVGALLACERESGVSERLRRTRIPDNSPSRNMIGTPGKRS